ncbi:hypothetical protein ACHAPU_009054 [Fusarium lateritium]
MSSPPQLPIPEQYRDVNDYGVAKLLRAVAVVRVVDSLLSVVRLAVKNDDVAGLVSHLEDVVAGRASSADFDNARRKGDTPGPDAQDQGQDNSAPGEGVDEPERPFMAQTQSSNAKRKNPFVLEQREKRTRGNATQQQPSHDDVIEAAYKQLCERRLVAAQNVTTQEEMALEANEARRQEAAQSHLHKQHAVTKAEKFVSVLEERLRAITAEEEKDKQWRQHLDSGVKTIAGRDYVDGAMAGNSAAMAKHNADREAVQGELKEAHENVVSARARVASLEAELEKLRGEAVVLKRVIDKTPSMAKGHLCLSRFVELGGDAMMAVGDKNLDIMIRWADTELAALEGSEDEDEDEVEE